MGTQRRFSLDEIDRILGSEEGEEGDDSSLWETWGSSPRRYGALDGEMRIPRGAARPRLLGTRPRDLPALRIPSGYRRDRRGTWRYAGSGRPVPGARDVTLARLWRPRVDDLGDRYVPDRWVRLDPALHWVRTVASLRSAVCWEWVVAEEDWEDRAHWPLGLEAPELSPARLLDVAAVAEHLSVRPNTVTSYLARGRLPAPQLVAAGRPLWALPVLLEFWEAGTTPGD